MKLENCAFYIRKWMEGEQDREWYRTGRGRACHPSRNEMQMKGTPKCDVLMRMQEALCAFHEGKAINKTM
jgi:hypothetical protein